jgi:N-acetyl-anhydromuramyl-L-alanine amidase AmpD
MKRDKGAVIDSAGIETVRGLNVTAQGWAWDKIVEAKRIGGLLKGRFAVVLRNIGAGGAEADVKALTRDGISSHFYVGRGGEVVQMVPLHYAAWHANVSAFVHPRSGAMFVGMNQYSLSIALGNWGEVRRGADGRFYAAPIHFSRVVVDESMVVNVGGLFFERYTAEQVEALADLLKRIRATFSEVEFLLRRSDIVRPRMKCDEPTLALDMERLREECGYIRL